jgi:hypothetical protein
VRLWVLPSLLPRSPSPWVLPSSPVPETQEDS